MKTYGLIVNYIKIVDLKIIIQRLNLYKKITVIHVKNDETKVRNNWCADSILSDSSIPKRIPLLKYIVYKNFVK